MDHSGRFLLGALLVLLPVVSSAGLSVPVTATSLFAVTADTTPPAGSYQHAIEPAAESAFVKDIPYIVSQRLGEQIDLEERRYFHLFPYVRRFEKAVAYRRSSGEVAFLITRRDTTGAISDTTITASAVTGGLVGGMIGTITGAAKGSPIRDDRQVHYSARPLMNQHAVFPYSVPPEIKHLLEIKYSPAGQ